MVPKQSQISWCLLAMVTLCWCCDAEMTRKSLPSARIYPGMSLSSSVRVHSNVALLSKLLNSVQDPEERKDPNKHINVETTRQSLPSVTTTSSSLLAFRCVLDFTTEITQTYKQTIFKSSFPGTSEAVAACTLTGRLGEWDSFQKLCSLSSLQACFECGRRIRSRRRP